MYAARVERPDEKRALWAGRLGLLLLAIGAYFDQLYPVAIAGLAAYAVWQLANMARLHRWLDGGEPDDALREESWLG